MIVHADASAILPPGAECVNGVPLQSSGVAQGRPVNKPNRHIEGGGATSQPLHMHIDVESLALDKGLIEYPPGYVVPPHMGPTDFLKQASDEALVWVLTVQFTEVRFPSAAPTQDADSSGEYCLEVEYGPERLGAVASSRSVQRSTRDMTVNSAIAFPWRCDFKNELHVRLMEKRRCRMLGVVLGTHYKQHATCQINLPFRLQVPRTKHVNVNLVNTDGTGVARARMLCNFRQLEVGKIRSGKPALTRALFSGTVIAIGQVVRSGQPIAEEARRAASTPPGSRSRRANRTDRSNCDKEAEVNSAVDVVIESCPDDDDSNLAWLMEL